MKEHNSTVRMKIDLDTLTVQEVSSLGARVLPDIDDATETQDEAANIIGRSSLFSPLQARYRVKESLGQGAAACVSLAEDTDIGRKVAIKEYKKTGEVGQRMCQRELQILGLLDHGGIPTIYDFGLDDEQQYYCVMRYVEGQTLRDIINKLQEGDADTHRKFRFHDRADIIIQLLRIVGCAHRKGLIHRDIKPENIMVGSDGEVSLIDWGIAQPITPNIKVENLVGTPSYMSPEQINLQELDQRSDIYSVAVVFYELLSLYRTVPLQGNVFSLINAIRTASIPPVDKLEHSSQGYVPSEFYTIVHKGLAREKASRYSSAELMLLDLIALRNGEICAVCPRTTIKGRLHKVMQWLDINPYRNVPIVIGGLILLPILCIALGFFLAIGLY